MSLKIQILVDNPNSWIVPYADELVSILNGRGHDASFQHFASEVEKGDILCLLACEKIFKKLNLNTHNLVVHESNLPEGKGWSPLTWQVLEGENRIPVTLIEATGKVDSGAIYGQKYIELDGCELLPEMKKKQGLATQALLLDFVKKYPHNKKYNQTGKETFYAKRTKEDSELNTKKTLDEQFNLLRVVDNERYPAFFIKDGIKYIIKIHKADE